MAAEHEGNPDVGVATLKALDHGHAGHRVAHADPQRAAAMHPLPVEEPPCLFVEALDPLRHAAQFEAKRRRLQFAAATLEQLHAIGALQIRQVLCHRGLLHPQSPGRRRKTARLCDRIDRPEPRQCQRHARHPSGPTATDGSHPSRPNH